MPFRCPCWCLLGLLTFVPPAGGDSPARLNVVQQSRAMDKDGSSAILTRKVAWDPKQTAVIVCDMWDSHHCLNAVRRVQEIAPRMNRVLEKARNIGALIIHAPSSCMEPYQNHPGRKRAAAAPKAANLPKDIGQWCHKIPAEEKVIYPLDQSDGGCDSDPDQQRAFSAKLQAMGRNPGAPWKAQIDVLKIHDQDAISDSGVEIWNLLEARGIQNVILVGVHTNMCVLGRPFGLRQMAKNGKNVVLMRDMTDTMYNPARWPYVSHFRGTGLIVEHIEKFVCPTITSEQLVGGEPFKFKNDVRKRAVVAIAEKEYDTKTTLPPLARKILEKELGFETTIIQGSPSEHTIPGLAEALPKADLLILSMRRVAIPEKDLKAVKEFLDSGKALVAIRTSSHAFDARGQHPAGRAEWKTFDPEVLGGNYRGHHGDGPSATIQVAPGAEKHPILAGIETPFSSKGSLYQTSPLASSTTALLIGSIPKQKPEPIAWTNTYKKSRIFYTSLGHRNDFENPQFVQLMGNAVRWAVNMPTGARGKR